jgi:agmatine/peptidylarginine deiminase
MITNFETNKVYLAKGMTSEKFVDATGHFLGTLHNHNVHWDFLPLTASPLHIWARDYMPVQVSKKKFVRFNYNPDYLNYYPEYKPDTSAIISKLGIQVIDSDITIDGGNVISCGDKVIMTGKIFRENPHYDHDILIYTLSQLLEADVVLIPEDHYDEYGHADGMVRYMGEGCVLLNNYCDFDKVLRKRLLAALSPHFDIVELRYGAYTDRSWAYINFLQVGQHILIPMIGDKLGEMAFKQIADAFPQCECHPVYHYENIVREGGALNCSTWNILVDLAKENNNKELAK